MAETNKGTELVLQTRLDEVNLEAWSDVDNLKRIFYCSLDNNDW